MVLMANGNACLENTTNLKHSRNIARWNKHYLSSPKIPGNIPFSIEEKDPSAE